MKIAIVYDVPYPWHVGGIEAMHYNAAVELAKKHEVHFFTTKWPGMKSDFVHKKVHYHAVHSTDQEKIYRHGRRSIREAFFFNSAVMKLFEHDFDVVITDYFPMLHLPLVRLYCKTKGAKLMIGVSEYWGPDYWKKYLGGQLWPAASAFSASALRGADAYVVISSSTKENMVSAGIHEKKIHVFAPVVNKNDFRAALRRKVKRSSTIIFSGRLIKEKRLDRWLDVLKKVNGSISANGIIIGSGPEKDKIMERIKHLKLGNNVKVLDFYKDKRDFYHAARSSSLILNMSEREGLSIICLEGAALGVPVLIPDYSPIPKEVREMCVVADENHIAEAAIKIIRSKDPKSFIRNKKNLDRYYVSEVNAFYSAFFRSIGAKARR